MLCCVMVMRCVVWCCVVVLTTQISIYRRDKRIEWIGILAQISLSKPQSQIVMRMFHKYFRSQIGFGLLGTTLGTQIDPGTKHHTFFKV